MADWFKGKDAAWIKPKLIPDDELMARDDSGGPEWDSYTQQWGDGGFVTGAKAHLSASGGGEDSESGDEISKSERKSDRQTPAPSKSKREARE